MTSAKRAKTVIAEVNDNVVETFGDSWLHVSEIDCFVPADTPVMVNLEFPEPNQVDLGLTHYVSQLVQDGDTIQVGVGSHSGALARLGAFDERENLSYFAELTTEGLVPLVERGIITGKYSQTHPDKFVATVIGNTPDEIATVHRNPAFETYSIEYLLDPRQIARNENIVAINGALTADLSGQLGVHTIGPRDLRRRRRSPGICDGRLPRAQGPLGDGAALDQPRRDDLDDHGPVRSGSDCDRPAGYRGYGRDGVWDRAAAGEDGSSAGGGVDLGGASGFPW